EVWFQDEMRVGQKNKLTYRWARKGSRPRAAHDQRTQSTYLFGAVCPERGAGAALVLPACNCEAMQLHLDEIATKVTLATHAIILLDQAGWHGAKALVVPNNISLAAAARTRTQRPGKHLAVHASELVVKPDFQILRRYRRPLLLRLEHTHRPTLEDYVHRATRLGSSRSLNLRIGITYPPLGISAPELRARRYRQPRARITADATRTCRLHPRSAAVRSGSCPVRPISADVAACRFSRFS